MGREATILASAPTGEEQRLLRETKEERHNYYKCMVVDSILKNQLVSAFDNPYLSSLKNLYIGYATNTTQDLIQNLYTHYSRISATYMAAYKYRLLPPYNEEEPLERLIERINDCTEFAAASSEPVLETQLVRIANIIVSETGKHTKDCRVGGRRRINPGRTYRPTLSRQK